MFAVIPTCRSVQRHLTTLQIRMGRTQGAWQPVIARCSLASAVVGDAARRTSHVCRHRRARGTPAARQFPTGVIRQDSGGAEGRVEGHVGHQVEGAVHVGNLGSKVCGVREHDALPRSTRAAGSSAAGWWRARDRRGAGCRAGRASARTVAQVEHLQRTSANHAARISSGVPAILVDKRRARGVAEVLHHDDVVAVTEQLGTLSRPEASRTP